MYTGFETQSQSPYKTATDMSNQGSYTIKLRQDFISMNPRTPIKLEQVDLQKPKTPVPTQLEQVEEKTEKNPDKSDIVRKTQEMLQDGFITISKSRQSTVGRPIWEVLEMVNVYRDEMKKHS